MKIQYLAFIRLPTEKAHGLQIMKTCEALADAGAEVELVVPGRRTHIKDDPFSYYGVRKNFTVTELKTPDWVGFGPLGFIASLLWFSEVVKLRKSFWNADSIYSRDALVLLQYILLGRPLAYEAHNQPSFFSRVVARCVKKLLVISDGLKKEYMQSDVPEERIVLVPDAADIDLFKNPSSKDEARRMLKLPLAGKIALYVGRIDSEKGADTFAESSEHLPDGVTAVLVGYGLMKEQYQKRYPRAVFLPETAYKDLPKVLPAGDVLIIPNSGKTKESAHLTSPLKLFAFMASGIPIVASDVPAIREVLSDDTGTLVKPDAPKALADGISLALTAGPEKGIRAKQLMERYTWASRAERILSALAV